MIVFDNVSVKLGARAILDNVSFNIASGETWAICGASGSGKTILARSMTGSVFHHGKILFEGYANEPRVAYIPQEHQFKNRQNTNDLYYQQRFNATESDDSLVVSEVVNADEWSEMLQLDILFDRPLLQLSNGENKRLQLAQTLQSDPDIVILDNPFLGLDVGGRKILDNVLRELVNERIEIILVTAIDMLPDWITHVALLDEGQIVYAGPVRGAATFSKQPIGKALPSAADLDMHMPEHSDFEFAVRMVDVTVSYHSAPILDSINWSVKKGECWNLSGPNGAGKSTLLSLITGDNPQAYSNEIYLFDRRRGSGESIWDIKKRIGFISPELHLYFNQAATCEDVIGSGFFDTIGLFRVLNDSQQESVSKWIGLLHLEGCRYKTLQQMSRGEQRFALLARALIKNPPLLILDEPTQGLDHEQIHLLKHIVNLSCSHFGTTLIYVSHYSEDIPSCVNKFLKLQAGRVV